MNNGRVRANAQPEREKHRELPQKAVMNGYKRRVKPRRVNPSQAANVSIDKNLRAINRKYVAMPRAKSGEKSATYRKTSVRVSPAASLITEKTKAARPFPLLTIVGCFLVTAVFMYMLSLYIKIDDYNTNISSVKSEIADLHEDATVLEVGIETKFNLDMVEKVAVEEYGMVSADTLKKTYVSVTSEDIGEVIKQEKKQSTFGSLLSGIAAGLHLG